MLKLSNYLTSFQGSKNSNLSEVKIFFASTFWEAKKLTKFLFICLLFALAWSPN